MCSRYEMNGTYEDVQLRFDVIDGGEIYAMAEIRPTNRVTVIDQQGQLLGLRWGLENSWDNKPLINARSETLTEKKTFIPLLENRCLVPATAYFEWRREEKAKIKTRIYQNDGGLFAFAGLRQDDRVTIITCAPLPSIAHIHNRMPVILDPANEKDWLSRDKKFLDVAHCLAPRSDGFLATEELTLPSPQGDLFS